MRENLIPILTGLIFLIIGVVCLIWPEKIQEFALRWSAQGLGKYNPFLSWMKTRSYVHALRIIGLMAVVVFVLTLILAIKAQK